MVYGRLNLNSAYKKATKSCFSQGNVKYEVLTYLNKRRDIEIVKLETRYMKKREKGLGLKLVIKRKPEP
jgi:hypothetical protein